MWRLESQERKRGLYVMVNILLMLNCLWYCFNSNAYVCWGILSSKVLMCSRITQLGEVSVLSESIKEMEVHPQLVPLYLHP